MVPGVTECTAGYFNLLIKSQENIYWRQYPLDKLPPVPYLRREPAPILPTGSRHLSEIWQKFLF